MNLASDFLVEIGTEELPAKGLHGLSKLFAEKITAQLKDVSLTHGEVEFFASPRRLAVLIKAVPHCPPPRLLERRGPALSDSFDASGKPTPAALGFAKSCGVSVESLAQETSGKVSYLVHKVEKTGEKTIEMLPKFVKKSLEQLPMARSMRWGHSSAVFLRPVRWVVLLFGHDVISTSLFGVTAGRETRGHRFHHPSALSLSCPSDYVPFLEEKGFVIPEFDKRRQRIQEMILAVSEGRGAPSIEADLLEEVTGLVEYPAVWVGHFSESFLEVPKEVLTVVMKNHQRYFPLLNDKGALLPCFVVVSNLSTSNPSSIISGNERVLSARLSDARFFYEQDKKQPFLERLPSLERVAFQRGLGSLLNKTERMEILSAWLADHLKEDKEKAMIAATLAKLDLTTEMVGEFPELQGIMGHYYAKEAGYDEVIAQAVKSHYQPRFSGDVLPASRLGCIIALADKIDTLVGIFGTGQIPTGEKDPFALRRSAIGVLRILIENALPLDLLDLLQESLRIYGNQIKSEGLLALLFDFMMDRLKAWYLDQGVSASVFAAVLARKPTQLIDFQKRIQAVQEFQHLPSFKALAMMNKRIHQLLKKSEQALGAGWDEALFEYDIEHEIARSIEEKEAQVNALAKDAQYRFIFSILAELQPLMDQFFDQVMVMADNVKIRENRLELLHRLYRLFSEVADISA